MFVNTRRRVDIAVVNKGTPTLVAALIIVTLVIASDALAVSLPLVSVRAVVIFAGVHCGCAGGFWRLKTGKTSNNPNQQ